jgi:hypothetical protein
MILHQKCNFIGTINRQYDDNYKNGGASTNGKSGPDLKIRLPNQYTVRTGAVMDVQDTAELSVTLTSSTQKGVDVNFTSADLTQSLDDFSERILDPAMSALAAGLESDAMSMYKDVYQEVSDVGAAISASGSLAHVLNGEKVLTDSLTPTSSRTLNLNTRDNADLVGSLAGLFNDPKKISSNFREGMVANEFLGYQGVFRNTIWPLHTTGTDDGTGDYLVNQSSVSEGATSITVGTGAGTWKQGDIFYFDSVNSVHPETKESTGVLAPFVVTADVGVSATTINFSPALYSTGGRQNVSAMPALNAKLNKLESDRSTAIGASADYKISMGYHKDAFAFATADLVMPKGVDFSAREVLDGISLRVVRQYDINNDKLPCRMDVLYGKKAIRPQLAVRYGFN